MTTSEGVRHGGAAGAAASWGRGAGAGQVALAGIRRLRCGREMAAPRLKAPLAKLRAKLGTALRSLFALARLGE